MEKEVEKIEQVTEYLFATASYDTFMFIVGCIIGIMLYYIFEATEKRFDIQSTCMLFTMAIVQIFINAVIVRYLAQYDYKKNFFIFGLLSSQIFIVNRFYPSNILK